MKENRKRKWELKHIIALIDELFGDTSVSHQTTYDALEEIKSEVSMKMEALKEDMKRRP